MASQPTGYNELINIKTNILDITIKGKDKYVKDYGKISNLNVSCLDEVELDSYKKPDNVDYKRVGISHLYYSKIAPMFYEQTEYEIVVSADQGLNIEFFHDNPDIRNSITNVKESRGQTLLTGVINFKNEIGLSDLVFKVNGKEYIKITLEVFPSKIDYVNDYKDIMEDVTEEIYSLVFDFLRRTYSEYKISDKAQSSMVEFYTIIKEIYDKLIKATDVILGSPYHVLEKTYELQYSHKIKRTDNRSIKWIERHPEQAKIVNEKIYVNKTLGVKKQITYNTKENQYTKFMLQSTIKRLNNFKYAYKNMERGTDEVTIKKIDSMIQQLNVRVKQGFMNEVDTLTSLNTMSLVFSMSPGYRDLYKYYLMLSRGLSMTGDLFHVSMKDMAKLYEYWCFIKLNSILKNKYELVSQDIIKVNHKGIFVQLDTGKKSTVKYRNPVNNEVITLAYNQPEREGPTVNQKPDNVLSLMKKGSNINYEYVFDAKYKIDMALPNTYYGNRYKTPGPKEEDINTMHRYRDAIVGNKYPWHRNMFGAYVLFPYVDEKEYSNHTFYKSIEEVNIGALPFLPSATGLVSKMLDELIYDTPDAAFNRSILPVGIEDKLNKVDWDKKEVLIANIDSDEQLKDILFNKEYYVSMNDVNDDDLPIRYIALSKKNKGIYQYGEVMKNRIHRDQDNNMYYVYIVREWIPLDITYSDVDVKYTNLFMLLRSKNTFELLIHSQEEYDLYLKLKRYDLNLYIEMIENQLQFVLGDFRVYFNDQTINIKDVNQVIKEYQSKDISKEIFEVV